MSLALVAPSSRVAGPGRLAWEAALRQAEAEASSTLERLFAEWRIKTKGDKKAFRVACMPGLLLRGPGPKWPTISWVVVARGLVRDPHFLTR